MNPVPGYTTMQAIAQKRNVKGWLIHRTVDRLGVQKFWIGGVAGVRDSDVGKIMEADTDPRHGSPVPGFTGIPALAKKRGVPRQWMHQILKNKGVEVFTFGSVHAVRNEDAAKLLSDAGRVKPSSRKPTKGRSGKPSATKRRD